MRNRVTTAFLVLAIAAVWGVLLGLADQAAPPSAVRYAVSPTAHVERRPALFVVSREVSTVPNAGGDSPLVGVAVPIALLEVNGDLRPPLPQTAGPDERAANVRVFGETYCRPGSAVTLLRGGANAGVLRFQEIVPPVGPQQPVFRGVCTGPDLSYMPSAETVHFALGISDHRLGSPASGTQPMRATHRAVAEQLMRRAAAERYPKAAMEDVGLARVSAADLNRDGRPEIVASRVLRVHLDARHQINVDIFVIAEPGAMAGEAEYTTAYIHISGAPGSADTPALGAYSYVDQVNLSPAHYDELVVSNSRAGSSSYLVLRRGGTVWGEVYQTREEERARDGEAASR